MSASTTASTPADADPQRLLDTGITSTESGRLRLPPILVEYQDGNSQNLLIEVGQPLPQSTTRPGTAVMTLSQFLHTVEPRNAVPTTVSNNNSNPSTSSSESNNIIHGAPTQLPSNVDRTTGSQTTGNTAANQQTEGSSRGTRGLDYPAFDVSRDGVYREERRQTRLLDGLLQPLQRLMEANYNRERLNLNTTEAPSVVESASANSIPEISSPILPIQEGSRNIILTVNYIYGQTPGSESTEGVTGSLILHVPNINETNDENLQVLVRLATMIALRTITSSVKRATGVPKEVFDKLEIKKVKDIFEKERECSICYDPYVDEKDDSEDDEKESEEKINENGKRTRSRKTDPNEPASKRVKSNNEKPQLESIDEIEEYKHVPVVLNCGHIFGKSCLSEWFKASSSCPLCRDKIKINRTPNDRRGYETTIVLPNLARIIGESREVIDGFNNRQMNFILPDQEVDPAYDGEQVVNMLRNNNGSNERQTTEPANAATNPSSTANAPNELNSGVMGFVRNIINNLNQRLTNPVRLRTEDDSLLNRGILHRLPIVRSVNEEGSNSSELFPMGVESRRTANGVVTRNVGPNWNDDNRSEPSVREDSVEQEEPRDQS